MADPVRAFVLVTPDQLTDWLHGAGHKDRIVYAIGDYLPMRCPVRDLAHAYCRQDLVLLAQPRRDDGRGRDYVAIRTAQPLVRQRGGASVPALPDDAMRIYRLIRLAAIDGDKLPDIKTLAKMAHVRRVDVFGLMQDLQSAGLVVFETHYGPVGRNWRVATLPDCGARTALPPEKWRRG